MINFYIVYKVIQGYIQMKRLNRTFESRKHYEWLLKTGLLESSVKFNEWGQGMEKQAKQFGYDFELFQYV